MRIRTLDDLENIKGKKILLRVDFNVPLTENGEVQDDTRIQESLPTINYLQQAGAKLIIISHLGRPDGVYKEEFRLTKIAEKLSQLIGKPVKKTDTVLESGVKETIEKMQDGEIVMLENVRCRAEEEKAEENFTKELASLGDAFVHDAFGTAHRKHASTWGLANYLPSYAGKLMEKEIKALSPLLDQEPKRPLTMIFGGAKIDTKIGIIKNFLDKADYFLIGGGLANTFLYALGYNVGGSLYEKDKVEIAKEIIAACGEGKLFLPTDVVIAKEIDSIQTENLSLQNIAPEMKILDIGEETAKKYCEIIQKSGTIIWNGPLGLYEHKQFQHGSRSVAEGIADSKAVSIIGGGDTADCVKRFNIPVEKFTHVSTGGGACIEFLSGDKLPGIEVLKY